MSDETVDVDDNTAENDALFGVQQTPEARMEVKISFTGLFNGRPYYPEARYSDTARATIVKDDDGDEVLVVETEDDLRRRVNSTAIRLLEEFEDATLEYLANKKGTIQS